MPFLGYFICQYMGSSALFIFAGFFALFATFVMTEGYRKTRAASI
jgi:hypothetical protein